MDKKKLTPARYRLRQFLSSLRRKKTSEDTFNSN